MKVTQSVVRFILPISIVFSTLALAACSGAYYGALEKVGIEKRDILVDRIEDTRDAQEEAQEQFSSALEQYRSVINVDAGELESVYDRMNAEYERSERRADEVRARIDSVESVAEDLFEEWEEEIDAYSDASLARQSQRMLSDTKTEYARLLKSMQRAERSMDPVLTLFKDQVLFLRHNLNARAIGALKGELTTIERATEELISEMQKSIDEASRFIESMK
jgi:gas vesicle protein